MQEQINIHLQRTRKEFQKLRAVILRLEQIIQRHLGAGPGHGNAAVAALDAENTDLVARQREIELSPLALVVALPIDEDAAVREVLGRVFEGAELGHAAGALEFAFVVPLLGEGHEEAFLALLVLQRDHGLLDVVVVGLELLVEVEGLVGEAGEGQADAFEFARALDAPPVLGADVDGDGVEEVLVVVVPGQSARLFELEDVFERGALQLRVAHRGDVDQRVGFGVGAAFAAAGGELVSDEIVPAHVFFRVDRLDHDFHEVGAGLDADDVEDAALGFHEEGLHFGIGVCSRELALLITVVRKRTAYLPCRGALGSMSDIFPMSSLP